MADLLINPNRYQHMQKMQQKQQQEPKPHAGLMRWLTEEPDRSAVYDRWLEGPKEKRPSPEELERKILNMRSKLRSGGRLSGEEKAYLARYAPGELQKVQQAEAARSALKSRLCGCKTREEAHGALAGACDAAYGADTKEDPDFSSVIIGQLKAAFQEMGDKPTAQQLKAMDPRSREGFSGKA